MDAEEAILRENGMNIHPSISEELAAKLKESGRYIINDWLKKTGADGKAIIDEFEKQRKSL